MGMNTHVYGIKAPSKKYLAMELIREACASINIEEPPEVEAYLSKAYGSDKNGEVVELPIEALTVYNAEMQSGYQVDITNLPDGIIAIRFVNSY